MAVKSRRNRTARAAAEAESESVADTTAADATGSFQPGAEPAEPRTQAASRSFRSWGLRVLLGTALGALGTLALLDVASLVPRTYPDIEIEVPPLPPPPASSAVRITFVETAEAFPWGFRVVQGGGVGRHRIAFRVALIEHPAGTVAFGAGAAGRPGFGVSNPFGRIRVIEGATETLRGAGVSRVLLPTLRFFHLGALDAFGSATVLAPNAEEWAATEGAMPRRYAYDPAQVEAAAERVQPLPMARRQLFGRGSANDVFRDGTVLVGTIRGSSFDEAALLVTLASGRRLLIVADSLWSIEQVSELRPRTPWAVWFFDRNRLRFPTNQRWLHAWDALDGVDVIALLDGEQDVPLHPERWD